jgi:hypothetical protein
MRTGLVGHAAGVFESDWALAQVLIARSAIKIEVIANEGRLRWWGWCGVVMAMI